MGASGSFYIQVTDRAISMKKILIADDHAVVRAGLKQIISEVADMSVAAEAADGREVLKKLRKADFDLVVLDLTMPGLGGLDVLKQIKIEFPNTTAQFFCRQALNKCVW
jgi:YesN/AraC family two-component response regulator